MGARGSARSCRLDRGNCVGDSMSKWAHFGGGREGEGEGSEEGLGGVGEGGGGRAEGQGGMSK